MCSRGVVGEREVVVAGDDHLVAMRERADPIERDTQLVEISAPAHVACVNEDVSIRDVELVVEEMRVGDRDDAHHTMGGGMLEYTL